MLITNLRRKFLTELCFLDKSEENTCPSWLQIKFCKNITAKNVVYWSDKTSENKLRFII